MGMYVRNKCLKFCLKFPIRLRENQIFVVVRFWPHPVVQVYSNVPARLIPHICRILSHSRRQPQSPLHYIYITSYRRSLMVRLLKGKQGGFVQHPIVRSFPLKRSRMNHTVFTLQLHTCIYLVKHSPDGATIDSDNSRLIAALLLTTISEEEDFTQKAKVRCEGAHPFHKPLSRRGLTQLSQHTTQVGRIAGPIAPAPLTDQASIPAAVLVTVGRYSSVEEHRL